MANQRQQARARARRQRQRERQQRRSRRQSSRQENRTRRQQARQRNRAAKIEAKGASGYWSPEGIKARSDRTSMLIDKGSDIGGNIATGGLKGLASQFNPFSSDQEMDFFAEEQGRRSGGGGGGGGAMALEPLPEEKPFYTQPIFIGSIVGIGALYLYMNRKK